MSLTVILALAVLSAAYWIILPAASRRTGLLILSLIMLYSLQPTVKAPGVTFILPSALILMVIGVAWIVQPPQVRWARWAIYGVLTLFALAALILVVPQTGPMVSLIREVILNGPEKQLETLLPLAALGIIAWAALRPLIQNRQNGVLFGGALVLLVLWVGRGQVNYLPLDRLNTLPKLVLGELPDSQRILIGLLGIAAFAPLLIAPLRAPQVRLRLTFVWVLLMVVLLYALKIDSAKGALFGALSGAGSAGFGVLDWQWVGLSYVVFRVLHVLFDYRAEALDIQLSTADFMTYALFFPTLLAGPISRAEDVIPQLADTTAPFKLEYLYVGGVRIMFGVFKKFVVAGMLTMIALGPGLFPGNTQQHPVALIGMLYAAFFLFYFDFSGYSDIAIGLGQLYGIGLPENFDRPFSRPNIQLFWQNWHMTLSTWFRQYWFNPLTRRLIQSPLKKRQNVIILITQVTTMVLIGLWHQVALNWVVWGIWQGLGLWGYKVISDRTKKWFRKQTGTPRRARLFNTVNVLLTFHYVLISFSLIALPSLDMAARYWLVVFGR